MLDFELHESDFKSNLKVNDDELSDMVDAFISSDHIEAYLDMIEKYESEDYGVGMADFKDIKAVTRGNLIEYVKINFKSDFDAKDIEEFRRSFRQEEFNVGVILFISIKNLNKLSNLSNILEGIYPNMEAVILAPVKMVSHKYNLHRYLHLKNNSRN